jgi:hypothetical protein
MKGHQHTILPNQEIIFCEFSCDKKKKCCKKYKTKGNACKKCPKFNE